MLRQPAFPLHNNGSPTSSNGCHSDMNSRGDYLSSHGGASNGLTQNRFSFQTIATSAFGEGVEPLVALSDVQSVNEYEDEFSWAAGVDGLHKHHQSKASDSLALVQGAFTIGKTAESNEDAYFISDRSFGIADGVSGWVDFGFSSEAFSNQLMDNCRNEIELFDRQKQSKAEIKIQSKRMRKAGSFMSFEMLDQ